MIAEHLLPVTRRERARGARLIVEYATDDYMGYVFATLVDLLRWTAQIRAAYAHDDYYHALIDYTTVSFESWVEAEAWLSGEGL